MIKFNVLLKKTIVKLPLFYSPAMIIFTTIDNVNENHVDIRLKRRLSVCLEEINKKLLGESLSLLNRKYSKILLPMMKFSEKFPNTNW